MNITKWRRYEAHDGARSYVCASDMIEIFHTRYIHKSLRNRYVVIKRRSPETWCDPVVLRTFKTLQQAKTYAAAYLSRI